MLSAFSELDDKVQGYEHGAEDYPTKPFYMRELIMRILSLIKRKSTIQNVRDRNDVLVAGDLKLQISTRTVSRQGTEISLTPRECQILLKLLESKGEIVSKRKLIQEIWGKAFDANTNTLLTINFLCSQFVVKS